jgi:monofunctional biosynthetic peptidoglycan transglycosylase
VFAPSTVMRRSGRIAAALMVAAFAIAAYVYLTIPDVRPLGDAPPTTTAFIELRAREAVARGEKPRRVQRWVAYGRISNHLKRAVLVAEDSAFWDHEGVDVAEIKKSIETNIERGRLARGGSTITQQLAKNLYLSPSRNPVRKLRELFIARRLEAELSKRRILELYLNLIEWGSGVYGAEAAAQTHFHRSASALGPEQSALLAAAIINPRAYSPSDPNTRLRRRQQIILRRMGAVEPPPAIDTASIESSIGSSNASEGLAAPQETVPPLDVPSLETPDPAMEAVPDPGAPPHEGVSPPQAELRR